MNVLCFLPLNPFFMPLNILKIPVKMIQSCLEGQEGVDKHQLEVIINEMRIMVSNWEYKLYSCVKLVWMVTAVKQFCCPLQNRWILQLCVAYLLHPLKIGPCVTRWVWEHSCGNKKINETCLMPPCPFEMPKCSNCKEKQRKKSLSFDIILIY